MAPSLPFLYHSKMLWELLLRSGRVGLGGKISPSSAGIYQDNWIPVRVSLPSPENGFVLLGLFMIYEQKTWIL